MKFLYCFDFDGVLVDSAAEMGISGYDAAKIMCPGQPWLTRRLRRPDQLDKLIQGFHAVRPGLETGWEAPLFLNLLTEDDASVDDIVQNFHRGLCEETLQKLNVSVDQCKDALKKARNDWIESDDNGQDWLDAHEFYEGACDAVRTLIAQPDKLQDVYVITTKAADFTYRLLEKQKLAGKDAPGGGIPPERIFGLGSPPKEVVLANLLEQKGGEYGAVFVEDRVLTLDKTMSDSRVNTRVVPVLASWGYTTKEQCELAKGAGYTVLNAEDSSTLGGVLNDEAATKLLKELKEKATSTA